MYCENSNCSFATANFKFPKMKYDEKVEDFNFVFGVSYYESGYSYSNLLFENNGQLKFCVWKILSLDHVWNFDKQTVQCKSFRQSLNWRNLQESVAFPYNADNNAYKLMVFNNHVFYSYIMHLSNYNHEVLSVTILNKY